MPKKIRVYELARELGLTNKEALDLCLELGIGVKSHSSSIEDAQADRVRRKADRDGLRRDKQPDESLETKAKESPGGSGAEAPARSPLAPTARPLDRPAASVEPSGVTAAPGPLVPLSAQSPVTPSPVPAAHGAEPPAGTQPPVPTAPFAEPPSVSGHDASASPSKIPVPPRPRPGMPSMPPPRQPGGARSTDPRLVTSRPSEPGSSSHPASSQPGPSSHQGPSSQPAPLPSDFPPRPRDPRSGDGRTAEGRTDDGRPADRRPPMPGTTRPPIPGTTRPPAAPAGAGSAAVGQPAPPRPASPPRTPTVGRPTGVAARSGSPTAPGSGSVADTGARNAPGPGQARPNQPGAPLSPSGKPIPPPPAGANRAPLSPSGKPIPPPPGLGGRGPTPPPPRPPGSARPGSGPPRPGVGGGGTSSRPGFSSRPPSGGGFSRPSGPGGAGGGAAGGSPFGRGPSTPGGPGAGRGAPSSFGGRGGRPPQRRAQRRRRRNFEELEAQELTRYTPSDAPIPEGEIIIERGSTAQEVGPKLNRSAADVVRFLLQQGEMVTATMSLSDDMIELFAVELRANIRMVDAGEEKEAQLQAKYFDDEDEEDEELLRPRPPVVTVMGHVDHGKTLLLDRLRETNVVASEAGGITQHIGAYQVDINGQLITFIDTPGHEAFTAMRARGAEVTDIVVLVVAADDGVMPQTIEAINHAKAADVPIIVAVNKIDRDNADPTRVMQQLSEHGLVPEQWGGDTIMIEISALQRLGVEDLLEQIVLVAELEELRENPEGRAQGVVLEANLDIGRGAVATVIVQKGTLRVGDAIVAGAAWGRVRALIDDQGDAVKEALPSTPVQVLGFDEVPGAGDEFRVTVKEKTARDIAELREQRYRSADLRKSSSATGAGARLEDIFEQIQRGETATLNLVLKADVQGSLEAVTESLRKLERDEVKLAFIHRAVGGITENDVTLAAASNATIIGFNVRPERKARDLAVAQDVEIRAYEIIYKLIEDIESAMVGMLTPEFEEIITGDAEVREVFRIPRVGAVAGCVVRNGIITRGSKVRFLREGVIIWKGAITSLKRFKEDVREVQTGFECGIGLSNNQDLRSGDVIETFEVREIPRI